MEGGQTDNGSQDTGAWAAGVDEIQANTRGRVAEVGSAGNIGSVICKIGAWGFRTRRVELWGLQKTFPVLMAVQGRGVVIGQGSAREGGCPTGCGSGSTAD